MKKNIDKIVAIAAIIGMAAAVTGIIIGGLVLQSMLVCGIGMAIWGFALVFILSAALLS